MGNDDPSEFSNQANELVNRYAFADPFVRHAFVPYIPEYDSGVDFILYRERDDILLKVQLKSRWTVDRKYMGRKIWVAFPSGAERKWHIAPHDLMVVHGQHKHGQTSSWRDGLYHKANLPRDWDSQYQEYEVANFLHGLTAAKLQDCLCAVALQW